MTYRFPAVDVHDGQFLLHLDPANYGGQLVDEIRAIQGALWSVEDRAFRIPLGSDDEVWQFCNKRNASVTSDAAKALLVAEQRQTQEKAQ